MALKATAEQMKKLLLEISHDLEKADRDNRAAAQRVRTNTIKFAKVAKVFRKESVAAGKAGKKGKHPSSAKAKSARKAPAKKAKSTKKKTTKKKR